MARTPDIAVRIRADGIAAARASIKAFTASATESFGLMEKGASQALSTLRLLAKPIEITIGGAAKIARTTALVGTLAAALAGVEVGKELDAGAAVQSMQAGIAVAVDRTADLRDQLAAARAEFDRMPASQAGFVLARIRELEAEMAASRDVSKTVDVEWKKVIRTANELGVEVSSIGPAFVGLANATKGTAAAGATTERTFRGMLMAGAALGRSNEEVEGSLLALQQIAGKGKVSMEELRGQLGERLPGAMNIAARAMGTNPAGLETMVAKGLDASIFLDRFSRQLEKEFAPAAEKAATRPQASFNRLRNAIFLARAEVANGGMAKGLGVIADSATRLVDRLASTGKLERFGAAIGRGLEGVPALLRRVAAEYDVLRVYAGRWVAQMRIALGIDTTGWADRTAAGFAWLRETLLQLAFDIPGVIYALREAFAGNDGNVADRYAWVLPLREFIQNQLMPLLAQVPGLVEKWLPIFIGVAGTIVSVLDGIRDTMVAVFGEEGANKVAAFLIIGRFTGILSGIAGALSFVGTAVRGVVAAFEVLRAAALVLFTPPAGLIVAAIAAVAALAYVVYQNWDSIKSTLIGVWNGIKDAASGLVDGLRAVWGGITDMLTKPFDLAKKAITVILDGLKAAVEGSPAGLIFKGGKFLIEQGAKAAGYATGGYVRGPGTGTSDSIPAWLSNREGVVNAEATQHYGGKRFIDSLNSMSFTGFGAPADVIEVSSGSTGRPMSFVMPGVGAASGRVDDDFASGMKRIFDRATAGRARQAKPRGHR